ncbi:MAG: hypothetical protein P8168_05455 [Deltaproteobacteria bacterium]|jgi:hypothetical protein
MAKKTALLALVLIGLGLAGCANYYNIKVNGYTGPSTSAMIRPGGAFYVMQDKEAKNPLLAGEIREKIIKLLNTRGYPVTSFDKADYLLFCKYGMGQPRSVGVPYYGSLGWGWGWGGGCGWGGPSFCWGAPYGVWGTDVVTLYDRWLQINVIEGPPYRTNQESRSVWVGEARSSGSSSDMRTILNYLLVADFKEFGKNTGRAITVDIKENGPEVFVLTH